MITDIKHTEAAINDLRSSDSIAAAGTARPCCFRSPLQKVQERQSIRLSSFAISYCSYVGLESLLPPSPESDAPSSLCTVIMGGNLHDQQTCCLRVPSVRCVHCGHDSESAPSVCAPFCGRTKWNGMPAVTRSCTYIPTFPCMRIDRFCYGIRIEVPVCRRRSRLRTGSGTCGRWEDFVRSNAGQLSGIVDIAK